MSDDSRREWFFELQKKNQSEWTPNDFQECLKYYDEMVDQAPKKGRREWIKSKKSLLDQMEQLGIEPYQNEDLPVNSDKKGKTKESQGTLKGKNRIMYIENKADGLEGPGRIARKCPPKQLSYERKVFQTTAKIKNTGFPLSRE